MPFDYPVFLDLRGVPVLVVGEPGLAERKVEGLVAAGAAVTVRLPAEYAPVDVIGAQLVFVASADPLLNARVSADAQANGVFVNAADDPSHCTFILPAIARSGRVGVAVSSGGASPALAQRLRNEIADKVLSPAVATAADTLHAERAAIHAAGESTEGRDWQARLNELLGPADT